MVNDIIWRAIKTAQVPASKEPVGLPREDAKRPNGATLIPWADGLGRNCTRYVRTVPPCQAGAAADNAAIAKKTKYTGITNTTSSYQ